MLIPRLAVIGDAHFRPGISNRRATWLGRYLADRRPDVVVAIGDWWDMPSLCSYDKGKACFEGRRYKRDVAAGNDALALVDREIKAAKGYNPRLEMIGGNHDEGRLSKAVQDDAKLEGLISLEDFQLKKYGWRYTPFLDPLTIGGFTFQHYFPGGVKGLPIGGESPALALINRVHVSCVAGHSHLFDDAHRTKPNGKRLNAFVAGSYLDPNQREDYAGPSNLMWDRGILELHDVHEGQLSGFEWIGMARIQRQYGRKGD